jgi:hypothetical protein
LVSDKPSYSSPTNSNDYGLPSVQWLLAISLSLTVQHKIVLAGSGGLRPANVPDGVQLMSDDFSALLPSAKAMMQKIAVAEAEKASEAMRKMKREEEEKKALIDRLTKPSGLSDEEVMKKAALIIERAAKNGLTEVQVYRFPNTLCTDRGRAVNQQEAGWEKTLTGIPKEIYEFWDRRLRPLGYRLQVQIVDFSGGVPGDIGITLKWG